MLTQKAVSTIRSGIEIADGRLEYPIPNDEVFPCAPYSTLRCANLVNRQKKIDSVSAFEVDWLLISLTCGPDLQHHAFRLTLDGALYRAPIPKDIQNVLDVGTGTGIWAIEFAEEHPSAKVLGVDLRFVPNLVFAQRN